MAAAPANTLHWSNADVEVHKVVVGPYENNVFVVRCVRTGDAVILCSDGLLECENEREESFQAAELPSLLRELAPRPAQRMADEINDAARRFAGWRDRQLDDYTVLVLKFL